MRLFDLLKIGLRTPPRNTLRWVKRRLNAGRAARQLPKWEFWLSGRGLAGTVGMRELEEAFRAQERSNPFPGLADRARVRAALPAEAKARIRDRARKAMRLEVDMLGSGPVKLRRPIDWATDFKSATRWPMTASRDLPINELGKPSDIKVPWELSRLQWLLPVAQYYVLEDDEQAAVFLRDAIVDWIDANPVYQGPNWICAMDVALRAIAMIWLYHACSTTPAWRDKPFREKLMKTLVLHGRFIEMNLEFADVNGNHLAADLAGLQLIGIALGGEGLAASWVEKSWHLLSEQLPEQVPDDGVCREGSLPYHRLVAELFALPAIARTATGRDVAPEYIDRLRAMAVFTNAATRPDGEIPIWGDADDGRGLPLGTQGINDHRYLADLLTGIGRARPQSAHDEVLWWLGAGDTTGKAPNLPARKAFERAGIYVLGDGPDHVFVDAGPVGMAGRGGHGHNDCLSFEASLAGCRLIVDPGSYVYTSDMAMRNKLRATAAHNTPEIDDQEINRFVDPRALWRLHDDAAPDVRVWRPGDDMEILTAAHSGYTRLAAPITPVRTLILEKSTHRLFLMDRFEGDGEHAFRTAFTLASGVSISAEGTGIWRIRADGRDFLIVADLGDWRADIVQAHVSPSYGVLMGAQALVFKRQGPPAPLTLAVLPADAAPPDPIRWLGGVLGDKLAS